MVFHGQGCIDGLRETKETGLVDDVTGRESTGEGKGNKRTRIQARLLYLGPLYEAGHSPEGELWAVMDQRSLTGLPKSCPVTKICAVRTLRTGDPSMRLGSSPPGSGIHIPSGPPRAFSPFCSEPVGTLPWLALKLLGSAS